MQRLDKLLSEAGVASRRELRGIIRAGRVSVDGRIAKSPEEKINPEEAEILVDGQLVALRRPMLVMLHKPAGFVTSTEDPRDRTVMELLPAQWRAMGLTPVGRLDKETEGLLLFTNDGALTHWLISPKSGVWKRYYAEHDGEAGPEDQAAFEQGLVLRGEEACLPARLEPLGSGKSLVEIQEGKYHQVRRMLASRGMPVTYLKRIAEGGLTLGDLPLGQAVEVDLELVRLPLPPVKL